MKTLIDYEPQHCQVVITADSILTEVSFAVESVISYFFGRGVFRFECYRFKRGNGDCELNFHALQKSGPMVISKVSTVGLCNQEGLLPTNLSQRFQESAEKDSVSDGTHRHAMRKKKSTYSIIETHELIPSFPISKISYGLSDMFTGFFALDVEYLKWQGSLNMTQLYVEHNLSDKALSDYFTSKNPDYDINRKVSTL